MSKAVKAKWYKSLCEQENQAKGHIHGSQNLLKSPIPEGAIIRAESGSWTYYIMILTHEFHLALYNTNLDIIMIFLNYQLCIMVKLSLSRNESGRFGAFKSDSTHHFFRNACTKSGSLRFSQFSGCWLISSVYILMSFDFPFVRLFAVR